MASKINDHHHTASAEQAETPRLRGIWYRPLLMAGAFAVVASGYLLWIHGGAPASAWPWLGLGAASTLVFGLIRLATIDAHRWRRAAMASDDRYKRLVQTANEGVWIIDRHGLTGYVNPAMAAMLGYEAQEMVGRDRLEFIDPHWHSIGKRKLRGDRVDKRERFDVQLRRKDGSPVWTIVSTAPILHADQACGLLVMVTDISDQREAAMMLERNIESQRILLNELNHRVRNNLSAMVSLVDLSRGAVRDIDEFADTVGGRIQAMAKAHVLLVRSARSELPLSRLLGELLPMAHHDRVKVEGPSIAVAPGQVGPLAVVFHELLARSQQSGALATADGTIDLEWRIIDADDQIVRLELHWNERGAFGTPSSVSAQTEQIVAGLVRSDLRGSVQWDFRPDGASHLFEITLDRPRVIGDFATVN